MSFNVNTGPQSQGNMLASNYIVNIIDAAGDITSASGLSPVQALQLEVNNLNQMVNFDQKRIFANIISAFDNPPIQFTDSINMSNSEIFINGVPLTTGGGTSGGGGTILSSGATSITLVNTTSGFSTAMAFNVGGRTVFSFDGQGRALYFDPSGTGNRFWISSATLVADQFQFGGSAAAAASGKFLQSLDTLGTATWSYVSTITTGASDPLVSISSGGVYFRTGIATVADAGRIDSRRNWYLGLPSLSGNGDLAGSNDFTVIGGRLRYQGGGTPVAGRVLTIADSLGNVVLSNVAAGSLSSFVVGDQIQSGATSVRTVGGGQYITLTQGANEIARFTGTGRLGISNSAPAATLDVNGDTILRGPVSLFPGTGGIDYVFTASGVSGTGSWAQPLRLFSGIGPTLDEWKVNTVANAIQGTINGNEIVRISSGAAYFGASGAYELDVNGTVAAKAFASLSPLRFLIGPTGSEVGRFADNGNFGIGVSTPLYKLHVAGSQSNEGSLNVSTTFGVLGNAQFAANVAVGGVMSASFLAGNGASVTNISTSNVGVGSNRVDIFEAQTRTDIAGLQVSLSTISTSVFSTLAYYNLAGGTGFFSTMSSYLIQTSNSLSALIGPGAGAVVSSYSTQVGIAMAANFSTLSSYIVTNTVQFSTLSSYIYTTSIDDRAYASTISFSNASTLSKGAISTFLSTGGVFTGDLWLSSATLGIGYKTGLDISGLLDVNGLIYTRGIRGISTPFAIGVGSSTTTQLIGQGYSPGIGWRYSVEGDIDISGNLYRNGALYTVNGTPDPYWARNGNNLWYATGNVGIGVTTPSYPLDVAGRIRCFGVDVIPGPGPMTSTSQGVYVSPWVYQGSNIYYNLGGAGIGTGISSVLNGVMWDVSGPVRIRNGPTYMSSLGINIPYGSTLTAALDVFGSIHAQSVQIDTTGVFGGRVTARDFLSLSDRRYKDDITQLTGASDTINKLRGVRFTWKDTKKSDLGFIAQEVAGVIPEAVGGDEEQGYHVSYERIVPLLVETVKKLATRVEQLESKLSSL